MPTTVTTTQLLFGTRMFVIPGVLSGDRVVVSEPAPAASSHSGTLSTSDGSSSGTVTLSPGHGIVTGNRLDVYWPGGSRSGMLAGSVFGNNVSISGGSGDDLPAFGTVVSLAVPVRHTLSFLGDDLTGLVVYSSVAGPDLGACVVLVDSSDSELVSYRLSPATPAESWQGTGSSGPLADVITDGVYLSQGNPTARLVGIKLFGTGVGAPAGPTPTPAATDSVTIPFTFSTTGGATYVTTLYDATTGAALETDTGTGSGTFKVPSGSFLIDTRQDGGPPGTRVSVTTPAITPGGSVPIPAPTHQFKNDESSGQNRLDSKTPAITLTNNGTVGTTTGYNHPLALQFANNTANYLSATTNPVSGWPSGFTLDFWIKASVATGLNEDLFSFGTNADAGNQFSVTLTNNKSLGVTRPGVGNFWNATGGNCDIGAWTRCHMTVTVGSPNVYRFYKNGEFFFSINDATALGAISGSPVFRIGRADVQSPCNSAIGEMRFYNRVLTADEIRGLSLLGITPPDPYDGLTFPTSAPTAVMSPELFTGRTHAVFLPANDVTVLPFVYSWVDGRLLKTLQNFAGTLLQIPSAESMRADSLPLQVTMEILAPSSAGSAQLTDGERQTTLTVVDPSAETWSGSDAAELKSRTTETVDACSHDAAADPTRFPQGYASPGANYNFGMWDWFVLPYVCSFLGGAYLTKAKGWYRSKTLYITAPGDPRGRDGALALMVQTTAAGGGIVDSGPQMPLHGWNVEMMARSEGGSPDLTFLGDVYPWLKASHVYHENVDQDGGGLYSLSATTTGSITDAYGDVSKRQADADGTNNDALWIDLETYTPDGTGKTYRTTFCDPQRTAILARDYDGMAYIAGLLGNTADQATYTARAAATRTAVRTYMWDEAQLRFQWVERSALARSAGTASAALAGDTSVNLTASSTRWLPAGCKLILPGGVVCQPAATTELVINTPTLVPILNPLAADASGGAATFRTFAEVDNCGMQGAPLFAYCATQAQAAAVRDRMMTVFNTTAPQSWECWFGSTLRANRHTRSPWLQWCPFEVAANVTHNATNLAINSGTTGLRIGYRRTDCDNIKFTNAWMTSANNGRMFYHPDWERVDSLRPMTVTVEWVRAGSVAPRVTVFDTNLNQIVQQTLTVPAGSDGAAVSATLTVSTRHLPGVVEVYASGGSLSVRKVKITHHVEGWAYAAPTGGFLSTPRISRVAISKPTARDRDFNDAAYGIMDYWQGDMWPPHVHWLTWGMDYYGLPEGKVGAGEFARRMLLETRNWGSSRGVWERISMGGMATGSPLYDWGSLAWAVCVDLGIFSA